MPGIERRILSNANEFLGWPQPLKITAPLASPSLGATERANILDCFDSGWIGSGSPWINQVEQQMGQFFGREASVVANGSVALMLALRAVGVRPGDEVVVPALTYAATASSVVNVGALPVFCDVDLSSWQMCPKSLANAIGPDTKAIVVPHTYGVPADMDVIDSLASKHGIALIEDAAEAFGAEYKSKLVGTLSRVGTFSFFPNKLITSGEGGLCITKEAELKEQIDLLRGQGMNPRLRYFFEVPGYNFRMTGIQAALLSAQMDRLESLWIERETSEATYHSTLGDIMVFPTASYDFKRSPWIATGRIDGLAPVVKESIALELAEEGIETRPVFFPLPEMPAFAEFRSLPYPKASKISAEGISLPTGAHVEENVYQIINNVLRSHCA